MIVYVLFVFFFKQKTAYEMRISDWSPDVCSSDLNGFPVEFKQQRSFRQIERLHQLGMQLADPAAPLRAAHDARGAAGMQSRMRGGFESIFVSGIAEQGDNLHLERSEEHTSELQSLMRISYAVFSLNKKILASPTYQHMRAR